MRFTDAFSLRIRMGHTIDRDAVTFRRNPDLPCSGNALMQFEVEVSRIAAEDSIPLHNEIRRLREELSDARKDDADAAD